MSTETHSPFEPLAIVGVGCLFPKADGPGAYWANVKHGVDCITEVPTDTHWDPADYFHDDPKTPDMTYARRGGFLSVVEFNPLEFGIAPRDIEATDTAQLLGLVAAKQALTDAGVVFEDSPGPSPKKGGEEAKAPLPSRGRGAGGLGSSRPVDRNRVSVILGVTGTLELVVPLGARLGHPKWKRAMQAAGIPDDLAADAAERIAESYVPWQENSFPGLLGNVVAGRIANRLDLGGTNCVVDAACASSLSAVHLAALELQAKRADVVVTGGVDTFNDIFMFMCFSKTPALSKSGDAKPFDADGDGTILGEGLGMVVMKRLADAERDGDTVYAVIRGIGSSSDGKGNAIYAPSAAGQQKALRTAYRMAGVTPDTIELVEGHGTGTKVGDATEATALAQVYNDAGRGSKPRPWCAIGSVKSQIGHTKAAAGAASLIKAALALYYKVLPPTAKVTRPVEPLAAADSPFYVNTTMRPWLPRAEHPRRAAMSAFGFGGSNFHAVLEEYQPEKAEVDWDGSVEILAFSGATPAELANRLEPFAAEPSWKAFARAAEQSRATFDPAAPCRLVLVAHRSTTDLPKLVAGAKAKLAAEPTATAWQLDGAYFGSGPAPGKLAVLFPGQGSQAVGMLRDLACLFPELLDALAAADEAVAAQRTDESDDRRLSDRVYPPTAFDPDARARQEAALRSTDVAQPAIGAVSFGAWRVLGERFGVAADAFAGHSYGELPALAAAGRIGPRDLFVLSQTRGRLMAQQRGDDAGAMLAVVAPVADVQAAIDAHRLGVVIANRNAPAQAVLSGPTAEVEKAERAFAGRKVRCVRLPVAAAFHSPLVADAAKPFRAALDGVDFAPALKPIYANTTAAEYPSGAPAARDLLGNQLANPVDFVGEIRAMVAAGVRTFVEVGPGSVLTRLAEATLADVAPGGPVAAFALDASAGKRSGVLDLALTLARLAARGHPVRLSAWEAGSRCRPGPDPKPGLTVPLCGANYVTPRPKRAPRSPAPAANGKALAAVHRPTPPGGAPMSEPSNTPAPAVVTQALQITQQTLAALQQMQEQTARLHRQFLDSQELAQRTLAQLVAQQQAILFPGAAPTPTPVPVPVAPPVTLPAQPAALRPVAAPLPPQPAPAVATETPPPVPAAKVKTPPVSLDQTTRLPAASAFRVPVPAVTPTPGSNGAGESAAAGRVEQELLAVVAEKTGYPADMLGLDMALDADLGVDSIKRVEILSALQERLPDAPAVKPEHLGTLHTLRDVAAFLAGGGAGVPPTENGSHAADPAPTTRRLPAPQDSGVLSPAALAAAAMEEVSAALLAVVAEKTGYPADMLGLDMALDADLGVDSIKRVEILSALQERLPDAPAVKPEHLGTLHTLRDVAAFLAGGPFPRTEKVPASALPAPASDEPPTTTQRVPQVRGAARSAAPDPTLSELLAPRTEPMVDGGRLRPGDLAAMLNLDRIDRSILQAVDIDLAAPRPRISILEGGLLWLVAPTGDPLADQTATQLTAQGLTVERFPWSDPDAAKPAGSPIGLVLLAPAKVLAGLPLNRLAFRWLQQAGARLRPPGRVSSGTLVATVVRFDGMFGLGETDPAADPTAGGLAGLVKTARHEWPDHAYKAIDLDPAFAAASPADAATALVDELLTAGPVEVGIGPGQRCTLELARTVRRSTTGGPGLDAKDVVLVTGGARGVTAEVAVTLAELYTPTVILTGRTPAPTGPEPEWLRGAADEAAMKKAIAEHLGAGATPKAVGEFYAKAAGQREVARTVARIEKAGAKVAYYAVNVANGRQVADLIHKVQLKHGPVTALVHGAGVLADRKIEDLTPDQFDGVYATKVDGARHLLDLLAGQDLKAVILFSSTTARFGRTGQLAYACANEVLNKTAQVEARKRPNARVVAINWGPWEGGMVTPALRKVFEGEGVGLIPLAEGGMFAAQELTAVGRSAEVVALGKPRASKLPAEPGRTTPAPSAAAAAGTTTAPPATNPPPPELSVAFELAVDVTGHPVLRSHVLDGRAVVPMALHMEWLAHAALHGNPGLVFHGFNDLRITHGVMVEDGATTHVRALAGKAVRQDKFFHVPVELRGRRRDGRDTVHSRAEVILAAALPKPPDAEPPRPVQPYTHPIDEVYRYFLFHGPDLHGIERVEGFSDTAFVGTAYPAPGPAEWVAGPLRSAWVADPLVLDASFQMMILWSFAQHGAGSLPCFAGRYRQYRRAFPTGPTRVAIRVTRDNGSFARADIDYLDAEGLVIAQVQDYECVIDRQLDQAFRRNQLAPPRVKT